MADYRELKCPYGDDFEGGDECDRCEQYELCMETYPSLNLIEIPKGSTNGDILKIVFPNIEADEIKTDTGGYIEVKYLDTTDECDATAFRKDWWNALYKKESE